MPFNLKINDSARFNVQFIDKTVQPNLAYTPSSAWVVFTYLINDISNSSSVTLSLSGGFWTGTWASAGVDVPSNVTWTVMSSCYSPADAGTIRIIDP